MEPFISIIICTFNNAAKLKNALNSLLHMEKDDKISFEILVVDNNSSDGTKGILQDAECLFSGKLWYVFEDKQGLSYARNRGIEKSRGRYLAFLDDDVIVDKGWLKELVRCIELNDPDCIGGKVLPAWEAKKPYWLTKDMYMNLGLLDYGKEPFRIISDDNQIVGANFAVRKEIFKDPRYLFKTELGRKGRTLLSGEETELFLRLLRDDRKIWYCPTAYVRHDVPRARMTLRYFFKWNYYYGQSIILLRQKFPVSLIEKSGLISNRKQKIRKLIHYASHLNTEYVELLSVFCLYAGILKQKISCSFRKA